ncbi:MULTISPECIES: YqjF family protein [unclassified Rhodococcus (in: high G+C Gram-positive bacteria)]|uniref:YqjF family protein n=1 Tax=unclassified Rhodococcus (in: high G+C Gram-positive bacteria) TaxID=192944 RepID=UPI001F1C168B|nr:MULTISPECIES: DUF2071 domain-containing protein [unclassified Rhodococcus (in: high G+C Gram-positive bacteria)]
MADRSVDLWPRPPVLPRPVVMDQRWERLVFLHWRVEPHIVAPLLPRGIAPDNHDGFTYVGLIGFEMVGAGLGYGRPVPHLGTFGEINVRLYSRDGDGRRGVVFRSLDATRAAVVLATNAAGVRYRWSHIDILDSGVDDPERTVGYRCRRLAPPHRNATTDFVVAPGTRDMSDDPLSVFLTARWGMHTSVAGRPVFVPNTHRRWPLRDASLVRCDDDLIAAAGLGALATRPPDSMLYSDGVRTQFGRPYLATPVRPGRAEVDERR